MGWLSNWSLWSMDDRTFVEGQFPLEDGVSVTMGGSIASADRVGFQDPIVQWINGVGRTYSFKAEFFARHKAENIKKQYDTLEKLGTKDPNFGRSHICIFVYGKIYRELVLIRDLNPIVGNPRDDGSARKIEFSITLVRYKPFSQKAIDPTKPAKESYVRIASSVEQSYEMLARVYYGDPLFGDRLRKRHPKMPLAPEVGEVVKIPNASIITTETVEPAMYAMDLETNKDAAESFRRLAERRSNRRVAMK